MGRRDTYFGDCKSPYSRPADCKSAGTGGESKNIKDVWHIHPNKSTPSPTDIKEVSKWRAAGYKGNPFIVGINESTVSFYNEKGELEKVTYKEFLKMGRQEDF